MKEILTYMLLLLIIVGCSESNDQNVSTHSDWQPLFHDESFSGWSKVGSFSTSVDKGVMGLSGSGQDDCWLMSESVYENFVLEMEFMLKDNATSGIAIRYNDIKDSAPESTGYVINLDHNQDQQNPTGSIINVARARWLSGTVEDGWNSLLIKGDGDHLVVMVNDTVVAETHARRSMQGKIGFRAGEGNSEIRNARIMELPETGYLVPQIDDYMRSTDKVALVPFCDMNSLEDWTQTGTASWEIRDSAIHGFSGSEGGFLISKKAYRNFYLVFKFMIKKEDNSGIFIRHDPASDEITTDNGIECNIYDHNGFSHVYSTGSAATHSRAWSHMVDYDDWNQMEIFAFDDWICMYVNGRKSTEAHLPENFNIEGNICIQGGIKVFSEDKGPSDIAIKDMLIKDFSGIPFLGY